MDHPGFEIYAGPVGEIRRACVEDRLTDLREGRVARHFVLFPREFGAAEILHVETAVASATGRAAVELEIDREEIDGGVFVDLLGQSWVEQVASLSEKDAGKLQDAWRQAYLDQEGDRPAWAKADYTEIMTKFIGTCRHAILEKTDLVMVWLLNG